MEMGSLRGAACLLLAHAGAAGAAEQVSFERHDIDLGTPHSHVALPGGYLGGELDEIAVFEVDEDNARALTVHALRGDGDDLAWRAAHRHAVGEDVIFVESVALAGGGDRLLLGRRGTLSGSTRSAAARGRLSSFPPSTTWRRWRNCRACRSPATSTAMTSTTSPSPTSTATGSSGSARTAPARAGQGAGQRRRVRGIRMELPSPGRLSARLRRRRPGRPRLLGPRRTAGA